MMFAIKHSVIPYGPVKSTSFPKLGSTFSEKKEKLILLKFLHEIGITELFFFIFHIQF